MSALAKYDAARNALQVASSVDEVKDIRDKAEAMAAYARQAKDTALVEWATEIKVRAERKAGQMLAEMPKAVTRLNGQSLGSTIVVPPRSDAKTLSDLGISKNQSSRWQKLASVPDAQFEHAVAAAKEVAGEVTTAAMLRIEKESKTQADIASKPSKRPAPVVAPAPANEDDYDMLSELKETVVSLADENTALKDRLAVAVIEGTAEEKTVALDTIESLRAEVKRLEIEVRALTDSRNSYQRENTELKRQCAMQRRQLEKLSRAAA